MLILNEESLAPLAKNNNVVRFGFVDATIRIYRSDKPALDSDEESDKAGVGSDAEEGLVSSQCSTDSERLTGVGPLFNEEDLLADTEGGVISEEDADVTMMEFSSGDLVAASIELGKTGFWLASAYMAYEKDAPPEEVRALVREAASKNKHLVVSCDANAHNTLWGSTDTNARGESILDFILENKLSVLNLGSEPTFVIKNREEVLDITLASDTFYNYVKRWRVLNENSYSDHRYIEFEIDLRSPQVSEYRNIRKTDWGAYKHKLRALLPKIGPQSPATCGELDVLVNQVTKAMNGSLKASCPVVQHRGKYKPPWWTRQLSVQRESHRTLFNQAKATRRSEDWEAYKAELKSYKKAVRTAQRESWQNYCKGIEETSEAARLRKILTKTPCNPGYLQGQGNTWTTSSEESLGLLLDTHFPGNKPVEQNDSANSERQSNLGSLLVTSAKIEWAINTFGPHKSPGLDGIYPAELQQSRDIVSPFIEIIIRNCLNMGYIPLGWRETKVSFIPKAGRSSHTNPKDFRPISLTSFLLKILERIVDEYLRGVIPKNRFSSAQHAYTKGKSTETALHSLVGLVEKSLSDKEFALVAFVDIEGAFNNIEANAIVEALEDFGVEPNVAALIEAILIRRKVTAKLGNTTLSRQVCRGTPQGGVLSPLLWIMAVNSLLLTLERGGCHVTAYADDLAIAVKGKYPNTLMDILRSNMATLRSWTESRGLGINPDKTEIILFTRKHRLPAVSPLIFKGVEIPLKENVKYLGLILDRKLTWKSNIENRILKANIALHTCKKAVGIKWGLTPRITHWLYTSVVRPILLYGIIVWWPSTQKASYLKLLSKVQRTAFLCIAGALRTTPNKALEVLLNLPALNLVGKHMAAASAFRLNSLALWKTRRFGHASILDTGSSHNQEIDYSFPKSTFDRPFKTNIPSRRQWKTQRPWRRGEINFYTDGSKLENKVGYGVFSKELGLELSVRLPDHCSVYQAEVLAIKEVTVYLNTHAVTKTTINIFSDSQAAIKSMEAVTLRSKVAQECRAALNDISTVFKVSLIWVPGHRDIEGNCKADELARKGTNLPLLESRGNIGIPMATCRLRIKNSILQEANKSWREESTCVTTRLIWPQIDKKRSEELLNLSRENISKIVACVTGHWLFGRHSSRLGVFSHEYCRSCRDEEEEETVEHFFCNCPALARNRARLLGKQFFNSLTELSGVGIKSILRFIREAKWFYE